MPNNLLNFKKILIFGSITLFLHSCGGFFKPDWSKVAEPDGKKRARQNVKEGKGCDEVAMYQRCFVWSHLTRLLIHWLFFASLCYLHYHNS